MAKYLVTGGAGFIGSNIVEELVARGEEVRVLDNLATGKEENLAPFADKIDFQNGDVRSKEDVKKALGGIDFVLHQAALGSITRSLENPVESNEVNANGTLNLLVQAKEAGVKRLVYASSSSAYGPCEVYPQKETFATNPISPYAVGKLAGENYCRVFGKTMGFETVSLRYFNVFGPRQSPDSKYSAVIPIFIKKLLNNEPCMINGDGSQSRDFTFVANVVGANLSACEVPNISGEAFNVACGEETSITDVAESIKKILGKTAESVYGEERRGDIRRSLADISKLNEFLKIDPKTYFQEGLKQTVEWFTKSYSKCT